ncbi:MAG: glycoside hydrolase family 88 protein [Bryobacteraceae bacterium]
MNMITRRTNLGLLSSLALSGQATRKIPDSVSAIIEKTLRQEPASVNTDWFGTCLMQGLLVWAGQAPETLEFARKWFDAHWNSKGLSPYSGPKSRTVQAGRISITTYAGHFGLSFPCLELFRQTGDDRARRVCLDIAEIILHQTARNNRGMVLHDDTVEFTIPDVCYFVVTPLMIGFSLDAAGGGVFRDQAVYQLRTFIDVFLNKEIGLAKTILFKEGVGKSYWTRATGWLLWAIVGMLRYLPPEDPRFAGFAADLGVLAQGIARVQDPGGGLHVFLNDAASPLETTGTAMCAMGLHEALRKRWLPGSLRATVDRAWHFVQNNVSPHGEIRNAYTLWALPAEQGKVEMDGRNMGWIPGFILSAAREMLR